MEPLILLVEPELDERAATATMSRAQRVYEEGARDISRVMRQQLTEGTAAAGRGFDELETKARKAYLGMQDAGEKVAAAERKAEAAKERGASNAEALGRRVERARLAEIEAIEKATAAYREYGQAADNAGQTGGENFLSGLSGAMSGARQSGGDMANEFAAGFAGSSALMRLGAAGGPIGIGLAGVAALGYASGKVLADNLAAGTATLQARDVFQSRLGVDDATMAQYGDAAGRAFINGWGASAQDNLRSIQFGVQAGLVDSDATDGEIQRMAEQLAVVGQVMEEDTARIAQGARNLVHTGLVGSYEDAFDLLVAGSQQGLDISGDLLDSMEEYATAWQGVGLTGADALGLINQMWDAGIRNTDVAADSIKELAISLTDGSATDALTAMGFDASDMGNRFAQGGAIAREALGEVLDALASIEDPMQRNLNGQDLFKTKWEDAKTAIGAADLSTAATDLGQVAGATETASEKLSEHSNQWTLLGNNIKQTLSGIQQDLADSGFGQFFMQTLPQGFNDLFAGDPRAQAQAKLDAALADARARDQLGQYSQEFTSAGDAQRARRGDPLLNPGPVRGDLQYRDPAGVSGGAGSQSLPPAPVLPLQYTNTAGLPSVIANAQERLDEANHSVAEKEARLNQLRQSNVADLNDIQKAENDLTKANQDRLKAEQGLTEARIKATEQGTKQLGKLSGELNELGNQLDADFGLSKGLGGVLENLFKGLGNALAAPFLQALGMVANANPYEGSGLIGIGAANGLFGQQYTPAYLASMQASAMGPAMLQPGYGIPSGGLTPTRLSDTGSVPSGPQSRNAAALIEQIFGSELRGTIGGSRDNNTAKNTHDAGLSIDIPIGPDQMELGDRINAWLQANAGALGLEYSIWRDKGVYPGTGGATGFTSPGHYNHIDAHFNGNATQAAGALTDLASAAQQVTGSFNGSGGLAGSLFQDASGRWRSSLPGWDHLIQRESSGINQTQGIVDVNSAGNEAEGLFQITPQTWIANGGQAYAPSAISASPQQQAMIASNIFGANPTGSDWGMGLPGRENPAQLQAELGQYGGGGGGSMLPGMGMPQSPVFGGGGAQAQPAGMAYPSTGGNSGNFLGGMAMDGLMAATAGLDMMMPGAGAAAKIGIQLANRTIGYGAQVAGIAGSGVLETLSLGDNPKGSLGASWLGKGLGGIAGAAAALPNQAGKIPGAMEQKGGAEAGAGGNTIHGDTNINVKNEKATEDQTGKVIAEHQAAMQAPPGRQ